MGRYSENGKEAEAQQRPMWRIALFIISATMILPLRLMATEVGQWKEAKANGPS